MENKELVAIGSVGIVALLILLFLFQSASSKNQDEGLPLNLDFNKKQTVSNPPSIKELQIQDLKIGTGSAEVKAGDTIAVHYVGSLTNGKKFDSSYERGQPLSVEIGKGQVIKGFEQGLVGMKLGGKRKILIPYNLGYGSQGQGPIPPNADLIFDVEIMEIKPTPLIENPDPNPEITPETPTPEEISPMP